MWRWIKQLATVLLTLTTFLAAGCTSKSTAAGQEEAIPMKKNPKILVAYYSQGGHTRAAAEDFKALTGGDIFEIKPAVPYPESHDPCLKMQMEQIQSEARPALASKGPDLQSYDVIFVGYPIWYYVEPMVIDTFLESADFSDKTVIPFCTSGGYPIRDCVERIKKRIPQAHVEAGIRANSHSDRSAYVKKLGIAK